MKFQNKKAIVTGANRSIGQAIAIDLAKEGAEVVISFRSDEEGAASTVNAIKGFGGNTGKVLAVDGGYVL